MNRTTSTASNGRSQPSKRWPTRVESAAVLASRLTKAQGFTEGNKRTGLLLARWVLDRKNVDGATLLPPDDREFADLLVKAASGLDVEE